MPKLDEYRRIKIGFKRAKAITKRFAKTYYLASRFLSKEKRYATYSIYAICRISDEIVDNKEGKINTVSLTQIKNNIGAVYNGSRLENNLLLTFRNTVNHYKIPEVYFDKLLEGMQMDLSKKRYGNFNELYEYCYRVAGVIGLVTLKILGYNDPGAEKYAVDLGIAMQLTNILRDIKEDFQRGRIYLPEDEMLRFGVCVDHISGQEIDERFKNLMKFQIQRARNYYTESEKGIKMIAGAKSRLMVLAMKEIYSKILDAIENKDYDVFSRRLYVNNFKKICVILGILIKSQYT